MLDFKKFVVATTLSLPVDDLLYRGSCIKVHVLDSASNVYVPEPVLNYLGKGDKWVNNIIAPGYSRLQEASKQFAFSVQSRMRLANAPSDSVWCLNGLNSKYVQNAFDGKG